MEAAWAEVLEESPEEVVAPAASMAPAGALVELALEEPLVVAPEAWAEAMAVVSAANSNNYQGVSNLSRGKQSEKCRT